MANRSTINLVTTFINGQLVGTNLVGGPGNLTVTFRLKFDRMLILFVPRVPPATGDQSIAGVSHDASVRDALPPHQLHYLTLSSLVL
jgi:hypothetical protein